MRPSSRAATASWWRRWPRPSPRRFWPHRPELLRALEAEPLNQGTPFVLFGLDVRLDALDRRRINRNLTAIEQQLAEFGRVGDFLRFHMKAVDHVLGRSGRREQHVPRHGFNSGVA